MRIFLHCIILLAASAPSPASAQALPALPPAGACRSEMDARLAFGLCADSTFDFLASGQYRAGIPTPAESFGYPIGSWHTTHERMESYLDQLSTSATDRVRVFAYGQSVERRTMHLVAISSEANIARLDAIRDATTRLANPRETSASEARAMIAQMPITVWLNAANDGNETAAFEAAIQLAYQLAAGDDARTRAMRDGALTLINLAHNPESHERAVSWYNGFVMGDPDPLAMEHRAPWGISTNNNHYQFDLNRDALGLVQTESRAVAYELRRWRPQVFVDLHGQTTQFFFPPAADPVNPFYPAQVNRWLETFGRGNANAFDQLGWSYYVRDVFDLFYPGYWDSYPALHGATGMTFETDGGGSKGVRWRQDDGTILTFADGIAHHFVASLATIETAVQNRLARLQDFHGFFANAAAATTGNRTVVLLPGEHPDQLARLVTTLRRHGIEVRRVNRAGSVEGTGYLSGIRSRRQVPAGAYLVDLAQPAGVLARTILAPDVPVPASFRQQELERMARNLRRAESEQEGYAFYDVTAWSLPLALGVDALWTAGFPALATELLPPLTEAEAKALGGWEGEILGARPGGVSGRARSAYVWRAGSPGATRLLSRLMGEGFNVAVAELPLVVEDSAFPRGTFIVRVERNSATLHDRLEVLAREAGVWVQAAQSAFQARGAVGTGGESTRTLRAPRVAVLAGDGVTIDSYGALWFNLERRLGQPFTAIRTADLRTAPLDRFDVLIVPDGTAYARHLGGEAAVAQLRGWVERGGTLVGYAGGATYLQSVALGVEYEEAEEEEEISADSSRALIREIDTLVGDSVLLPPTTSPGIDVASPIDVPGAFLRGILDRTHWLTFGYETPELPLLVSRFPLRASKGGANPVTFAGAERLVVSGFTWPTNTRRAYAGGSYATTDRVGSGRIILLAEDPLFRGLFDAPAQLLWNAIYLGARGL